MNMTAEQRKEWAYGVLDYIEQRDAAHDLSWVADTLDYLIQSMREEGISFQESELDALAYLKELAA